MVGTTFFPRYLEPFAPERIVGGRGRVRSGCSPTPTWSTRSASVLKVRGSNNCGSGVEGTGFLYSDGRLMTNAHVVAGVASPRSRSATAPASPPPSCVYDPDIDVAVLALDDGDLPHLVFDREAGPQDGVAIVGYPQDGPYDVQAGRIRSEQRLRSPDIYGEGTVIREVFSLRGLVRAGNSGGPIVSSGGDVVGPGLRRVGHRPRHGLRADGRAGRRERRAWTHRPGGVGTGAARRSACQRSAPAAQRGGDLAALLDRALGGLDLLDLPEADEGEQGRRSGGRRRRR